MTVVVPDDDVSVDAASGTSCGSSATYTFDSSNGILTISGTGAVSHPSGGWPTGIKSVKIEEGITSIGSSAFSGLAAVNSVSFPDSLTAIGNDAFSNCLSLKSVVLDGVSVGSNAFKNCSGVTTLTIGSGSSYTANSFDGMSGVTELNYGISNSGSVLTQHNFASKNKCTVYMTGTSVPADMFRNVSNVIEVDLGSSISSISGNAFGGNTSISKIVIECRSLSVSSSPFSSLTNNFAVEFATSTIPGNILKDVDNVTSVTASQVPTKIGINAFAGTDCDITIDTYSTSSTVEIKDGAFKNAAGNISILEDAGGSYRVEVGEGAFQGCTGTIVLGDSNGRGYISQNAFLNCTAMTNATGLSLVDVGDYAFQGCTKLASATFSKFANKLGSGIFTGCPINSISYSATNAKLSSSTFSGITSSLVGFTFGDNVSSIPADILNGKNNFSVTLGKGVMSVGDNAFRGCIIAENGLTAVDKLKNIGVQSFKECRFDNPDLTGLTKLEKIGSEAFASSNVTKIIIPASVKELANDAYDGCHMVSDITLVSTKVNYSYNQHSIFNNTGSADSHLTLHFGTGFTSIPDYAFKDITYLSKADLDNIVSVGDHAFDGCRYLDSVVLGSTVKEMGTRMFDGCNITSVLYSAPEATVAEDAFGGMSGNSIKFVFDGSVKNIPAGILSGCSNCNVTIGANTEAIGAEAFESCRFDGFDMSTLTSLKTIGERAFAGSGITNICIGTSVQSIGAGAFHGCGLVKTVEVLNPALNYSPGNVSVFADMGSADGVALTLGPLVTAVPDYMFKDSNRIASVGLDNVVTVGAYSFANTAIEKVTFPATLTSIGAGAFSGVEELTDIVFLNPSVSIGKNAFKADADHLDTNIYSQRHSAAAEYPWHEDNRVKHMDYYHVDGEYSGMAEILFDILSFFFGPEIANSIIDFFFDNFALTVLEAIDLGDKTKNQLLLAGIALLLLLLLFLFLFVDVSEGIRTMELIMSMLAVVIVAVNTIRLLLEYPDWYSVAAIWVAAGALVPVIYSVRQFRASRMPYEGETLLRLYSLDNIEIKSIIKGPWAFMGQLVKGRYDFETETTRPGKPVRILATVFMVPIGIVASAIFSLAFIVFHLPAYVFSLILQKLLSKADLRAGKHVQYGVCPECGAMFPNVLYRCENTLSNGEVCGELHTELVSGKYGIHKAVCGKCRSKIRCTYVGRRWEDNVTPLCPNCGVVLDTQEAEPFVIPMVGAVGAGKTSLLGSAFREMTENSAGLGIETRVLHEETEQIEGEVVTDDIAPTAVEPQRPHVVMFSAEGDWKQKAVYAFDPSGECFMDQMYREQYYPEQYGFADGVILVINPFSLVEYCLRNDLTPDASTDINAVFESFMMKFDTVTNDDGNKLSNVPVAVVVTKSAITGLVPANRDSIDSDYLDGSVKEFLLENGMSNLLNGLEFRFSNIRFFACNCAGADIDGSTFVPLAWIMKQKNGKMKDWFN